MIHVGVLIRDKNGVAGCGIDSIVKVCFTFTWYAYALMHYQRVVISKPATMFSDKQARKKERMQKLAKKQSTTCYCTGQVEQGGRVDDAATRP